MKVKFIKNYTLGSKSFKKEDIVKLHWTLADELIREKVVKKTSEITDEDKIFKNFIDNGDNG